jgi:predicted nucleotidyltransferase
LRVNREAAVGVLRDHLADLRAMGIESVSIFGSVARDEAGALSDVDVLVDFRGPATFDAFMDLKLRLEAWLGARVDLVTRKALRPRIRARIEAEAIRVA